MSEHTVADVLSPVRSAPTDGQDPPEEGVALCLSGGGYRAMVFHLGVLWRLNETRQLAKLKRISSVSGGSITAGVLGRNWSKLDFTDDIAVNFVEHCVDPVRAMARVDVDVDAVAKGLLLPGVTIADRVAKAYRRNLFGKDTLQRLPDQPEFIFNATNLESGALLRFGKRYLADYRVGRVEHPDIQIATAVAASSAFPPFLSPMTLDLEDEQWIDDPGNDLTTSAYRGEIRVSDGGVYDNLGLETAWKNYTSVIVSDGGGHMAADPTPPRDWLRQTKRVLDVVDNQVRSLRKRQVIESFKAETKDGMYVGIRSHVHDYPVWKLDADTTITHRLAEIGTRLDAVPDDVQEQLINWGYVVCDAGLRSFHLKDELMSADATDLPYRDQPLT